MTLNLSERLHFARALRSPAFALVWSGQTVSLLGDGAYYTALAWQVLVLTGSATAMGEVAIAAMAPRVLFLLAGGVAADRLPRWLVLLWSDVGRSVAVLLIALLSWGHLLHLWHLIVLALVFGIASGFFMPAFAAIPPQLVGGEHLASANTLTGLSEQLGYLVGPPLGALLVALGSPASAFAFDGLTFLVSAACLLVLRAPTARALASMEGGTVLASARGRGLRGVAAELRAGLRYVTHSSWLWVTIMIVALANIGWTGPEFVALPKLVHDVYGAGPWLLGTLAMAMSAGAIVGTLLIGQVRRVPRRGMLAYGGAMLASVGFIIAGLPLPHAIAPVVLSLAMAANGCGLGIFGVIWVTVLQEMVPGEKLGRVSSIDQFGSFALLPIGYALAGVFTDRVGPAWVFVAGGTINLALLAVGLSVRGVRDLR